MERLCAYCTGEEQCKKRYRPEFDVNDELICFEPKCCANCAEYDDVVNMCNLSKIGVEDTDYCTFGYEQKN